MSPLERRYRWLLRCYPAHYRAQRAEEMLATLLETASPGQRQPGVRESAGLIAGGIRARAARNASLPLPANLRLAAMLAGAVYLSLFLGDRAGFLIEQIRAGDVLAGMWLQAGICAAVVGATSLIWFVRRRVAVPVLLAVSAIGFGVVLHALGLLLAAVLLALLAALRAERPPASWLWWVWTPMAFFLPPPVSTGAARILVLAVFLSAPVVWVLTDARPAFALAIVISYLAVSGLVRPYGTTPGGWVAVLLAISLVAALPFLLRTRRRRRAAL